MTENRPRMAICYDFDKTLSPDDMQTFTLIPSFGIDKDKFWAETDAFARENSMESNLSWMFMLVRYSRFLGKSLKREYFRAIGAQVELYRGVTDWFARTTAYAAQRGIELEHYIISSGLKEIIEGSAIAKNFKRIYASSYLYTTDGVAEWPAQAINYTNKTQFIFRIAKGFLEEYDEYNIEVQFKSAATVSITYALMSRCGLEPEQYFGHEDFMPIFDFNTPAAIGALGTAVSQVNQQVLRQIGVTIQNYERAKGELAEMEELFKKDYPDGEFASWDWWYYAEKVRRRDYALDDEALRPYFTLENVQGGIFFLANRLYGITFRPIVAPLYNPDCLVYEVLDEDESHLGVLYFDYYVREGKSGGAWCGNFTEQYYENGERVAPVVGVVTNYARPTRSTPTLLNLDETKTLFHEFGHALHSLFRKVEYRGLADVEGDFVELPSQVMENWATEPEMLEQYALHYRTNDKIPESLVRKIRRSAQFNQGFEMTELLAAALSDMDIHSQREYAPFDVNAFEREALYAKRGLIPQIEPRYRYPYFSHIFDGGYSAGYYFYIWAQVLDKDAYEAFRRSGDIFNRKIARAFREKLLSRGGEADGMTLYRDFRGQDPDKAPLLKACGFWVEPEPETDSLAVVRPAAERQLMPPANLLELRDKQENLK